MNTERPHIICHMASTVDGRIIVEGWGSEAETEGFSSLYEKCHSSFDSEAWLVGRVTMEKDFTEGRKPEPFPPSEPIARNAYIGDHDAKSFAIAIDAAGKLGWETNEIDGDHVIVVLTEKVDDAYLNYLQHLKVSYVFAGETELDLRRAVKQLGELFPIKTIMLEGGGNINGSFLAANLVDELSLLILPLADGTSGFATVFEVRDGLRQGAASRLQLQQVEKLEGDVVWLRYRVA